MKTKLLMMQLLLIIILGTTVPSIGQDGWLEGCQLPNLNEGILAAKNAQVDGQPLAFADALDDIVDEANRAYAACIGEIARSGDALVGVNLSDTNLENADLSNANLQYVEFYFTDLDGANLSNADLQGAIFVRSHIQSTLSGANLEGTHFPWSNMQSASLANANLRWTNFRAVDLEGSDLNGANLLGANLIASRLENVNLDNAAFDTSTILPDGSNWSSDTDMARFTDPSHPNYWNPCTKLADWLPYC